MARGLRLDARRCIAIGCRIGRAMMPVIRDSGRSKGRGGQGKRTVFVRERLEERRPLPSRIYPRAATYELPIGLRARPFRTRSPLSSDEGNRERDRYIREEKSAAAIGPRTTPPTPVSRSKKSSAAAFFLSSPRPT